MKAIISARKTDNKDRFLRDLRSFFQEKKALYILVPEQATLDTERMVFEGLGEDILLDQKVLSLSSFSRIVLEKAGGIKRPFISRAGQVMVLRGAFQENQEDLEFFKSNWRERGFLETFSYLVSNLKSSLIEPDTLLEASYRIGDERLSQKVREIALVYSSYEKKIEGHYVDTESRLDLVLEKLPYLKEVSSKPIFFYSYSFFTKKEYQIIELLNDLGADLTFYLVLDPRLADESRAIEEVDDFEAFEGNLRILNYLKKIDENMTIVETEMTPHPILHLGLLNRQIFSYRNEKCDQDPKNIDLMSALNPRDEVEEAAMRIRKGVQEGKRYRDYRIILTNEELYLPEIRSVFDQMGLPFFIDKKKRLLENGFVKVLFDLFYSLNGKIGNEGLFSWLKSPYSGADLDSVNGLEKYAKKRRLKGSMIFSEKSYRLDLEYYQDKEGELYRAREELEGLKPIRELLDKEIFPLYDNLRKKRTTLFFAQVIADFIRGDVMKAFNYKLEDLKSSGLLGLFEEYRQVPDILSRVLDQMVELMGDQEMSFSEFLDFFEEGVESSGISIIPPAKDIIEVGSIKSPVIRESDQLMILGLADIYYPLEEKETGILNEREMDDLREEDLYIYSPYKKDESDSKINLIIDLDGVRGKLYLSYPLQDSSGSVLQPARIIEKAKSFFSIGGITNLKTESSMERNKMDQLYLEAKAYGDSISLLLQGRESSFDKAVFSHNLSGKDGEVIKRALIKEKRLSYLDKDKSKELFFDKRFSSSQLETYKKCPYQYFLTYGLKAEEEEGYGIDAREMGRLLHQNADLFSKYLAREKPDLEEGEIDLFVEESFGQGIKEVLDEDRAKNSRNKLALEKLREEAKESCRAIYKSWKSGKFEFAGEEIAFKRGGDLPSLPLDDKGQAFLEGRIDRLDFYEKDGLVYYRVLDYKTTEKDFDLVGAYQGLDMQLLIYLLTVIKADPGNMPAGVFYMPLYLSYDSKTDREDENLEERRFRRYDLSGLALEDQDIIDALGTSFKKKKDNIISLGLFERLLDHTYDLIREEIEDIRSGKIEALPFYYKDDSACRLCPYKTVCRFEYQDRDDSYSYLGTLTFKEIIDDLEGDYED